jgi:hypothetical protein
MSKNFLLLTHYFFPALAQALKGVVRNPGNLQREFSQLFHIMI